MFNTGASYAFNGLRSAGRRVVPERQPVVVRRARRSTGSSAPAPARPATTRSTRKVDGELDLGAGPFNTLKFGYRWAEHERSTTQVAQGPIFAANPFAASNLPQWNGETYPGNFGDGLGGNFPRNVWQISPGELERWGNIFTNRDPVSAPVLAGRVRAEGEGERVLRDDQLRGPGLGRQRRRALREDRGERPRERGDPGLGMRRPAAVPVGARRHHHLGVRLVLPAQREEHVPGRPAERQPEGRPRQGHGGCASQSPARSRGPTSARSAARITADDTTLTGNGGNPDLKPIRSTNADAALEWYYAPRSLLSAGVFYMNLEQLRGFGTYQTRAAQHPQQPLRHLHHLRADQQQRQGEGRGAVVAGAAVGQLRRRGPTTPTPTPRRTTAADLVGASKNVGNVGAYYENERFGVRLAYTYRSRASSSASTAARRSTRTTPGRCRPRRTTTSTTAFSLNFEALNLNDPILKYYGLNQDQPRAFYRNGRQYYFGIRAKLESRWKWPWGDSLTRGEAPFSRAGHSRYPALFSSTLDWPEMRLAPCLGLSSVPLAAPAAPADGELAVLPNPALGPAPGRPSFRLDARTVIVIPADDAEAPGIAAGPRRASSSASAASSRAS